MLRELISHGVTRLIFSHSVPSAEAWSRSCTLRSHWVCEDWCASSHYQTPVHFLSIVCLSFLWTLSAARTTPVTQTPKSVTVIYTHTAVFSFVKKYCADVHEQLTRDEWLAHVLRPLERCHSGDVSKIWKPVKWIYRERDSRTLCFLQCAKGEQNCGIRL